MTGSTPAREPHSRSQAAPGARSEGAGGGDLRPPRIHIRYSDQHFHPDKKPGEKQWYSCTRIASHFWSSLEAFGQTTYGDRVPDEEIDLLWTPRPSLPDANVKRFAFFATGSHPMHRHRQLGKVSRLARSNDPWAIVPIASRWLYWLTTLRADRIVVLGNEVNREVFLRDAPVLRERITVVDCGVDFQHFRLLEAADRGDTFVYPASWVSEMKGGHILAAAWRVLQAGNPSVRLLVLGRDRGDRAAAELRSCPNVEYLGEFEGGSERHIALLNTAKWVVYPSLGEGQAGTLLEAMSCGCIPIASRHSGIDGRRYGGYRPGSDDPRAWAGSMGDALREWRPERHAYVREQVEVRHDWRLFDDTILGITRSLLSTEPASAAVHRLRSLPRFVLAHRPFPGAAY